MKHLTTLITTLLLSIIASQMSADTGGTYRLVTDPNDLEAGDIIVIASYDNNNKVQIMTNDIDSYHTKDEVSINNSLILMPLELYITVETVLELYIASVSENSVTLRKSNNLGNYLSQTNNTNLTFSPTIFYWNLDQKDEDNLKNGICLTASDSRSIRAYNSDNGFKIQLGSNVAGVKYNLAVCYKKVITPPSVHFEMNNYGYATLYYSDKSLILPAGLKAYTYTVEGDELKVLDKFDGNSSTESKRIVPKGAAVMVQGTPGNYELEETTADTYSKVSQNVLAGTDEDTTPSDDGEYYMLSTGNNGIGFYWGADNGAAFTNKAHKAYLRIPADNPISAKALHFSLPTDDDAPTAITTTTSAKNALPTPSYNLQGINATHSGIVISNGKKFIRR